MRDGGAYGCAVPRAYANLNPGLSDAIRSSMTIRDDDNDDDDYTDRPTA